MKYSKSTGGFYLTEIHGVNIPSDVVDISDARYSELMIGQAAGHAISADTDEMPILVDLPTQLNPRIAEIAASLVSLDMRKIRPLATGDTEFLAILNTQSDTLRTELKGLTA